MPDPRTRPTVGCLIDALLDGYQEGIWNGIAAEAEALDLNLLCFLGGAIWHKMKGKAAIGLIGPENVDGLVALSGSIGSFMSQDEMVAHYRQLAPTPIVSIGKFVPGTSNLLIDNESGVRDLVGHLIEVHGRRRVAFIRGPATDFDAEARFKAYRESLERHGIPFEPARVFQGGFDRNSGIKAVQALVDEREVEFDALVGANDYMAIYAMSELQRRGVPVPEDVAVAGFDDIKDAAGVRPALTTVRQPLLDLGKQAIQTVLALLRRDAVPESTLLKTRMVVRRSCGCPASGVVEAPGARVSSIERPSGTSGNAAGLAGTLEVLFPELGERLGFPAWAKELARTLFEKLEGSGGAGFLRTIEGLIDRGLARQTAVDLWFRVLSAARGVVRADLPESQRERIDLLWESALATAARMAEQAQIGLRIRSDEELRIFPRMFVNSQLGEAEIKREILNELPTLGIRSFYLSRFTDSTPPQASLLVHFAVSAHVRLDSALEVFPTRRLVPGKFSGDHRWAYVVLPLQSQAEQIGFALCEMGALSGAAYEALMNQISTALKVSALWEEVQRHASELEAKVEERTRQLREAQQRLVEAAHQAGRAEIAVGLMHNLGNLLNSVNVSAEAIGEIAGSSQLEGLLKANDLLAEHGQDLARFFAEDPRGSLLPAYYQKVGEHLGQERQQIQSEVRELLEKASLIRETIKTLQDYATGGGDIVLREAIEIPALVDRVLKIEEAQMVKHHVQVRRDFGEVPPVIGQRARLIHVLVNVVKNAVEAMRDTPVDRRFLDIQVGRSPGGVQIRISDSGVGIPPEALPRIFSYGFSTKADGHGFGLHTSAAYMNQLGGNIAAESDGLGRGATFTLVFSAAS